MGNIGPIKRKHEIPDPVQVPDYIPEKETPAPSKPVEPEREPVLVP